MERPIVPAAPGVKKASKQTNIQAQGVITSALMSIASGPVQREVRKEKHVCKYVERHGCQEASVPDVLVASVPTTATNWIWRIRSIWKHHKSATDQIRVRKCLDCCRSTIQKVTLADVLPQ